jgi:hypothetical protein
MSDLLSADETTLLIDGVDCAGEFAAVDQRIPNMIYEELADADVLRFLGPTGYQISIVNPSRRLLDLVDGGAIRHQVTVALRGAAITHTVQFLKSWEVDGGIRMFGRLAQDDQSRAQWVEFATDAASSKEGRG